MSACSKKTDAVIISINDDASPTDKPHAKKPRLADVDIEKIIMGVRLTDSHINIAQKLLKDQFSQCIAW